MFKFRKKQPPKNSNYIDVVDLMLYQRGMDVMPYLMGVRLKVPHSDKSVHLIPLESEEEIENFKQSLNRPLSHGHEGEISWEVLRFWINKPSELMSELPVFVMTYPDDETKDWPFCVVNAHSPASLVANPGGSESLMRGRYQIHPYDPKDRDEVRAQLQENISTKPTSQFWIDGSLEGVKLKDVFNPTKGTKN